MNYKDKFEKEGYVLLKNVFTEEEVTNFRKKISDLYSGENETGRSEKIPDLADIHYLRDVITNQKILAAIKDILGNKFLYIIDSAIHKGVGIGGWHRDIRQCDRYDLSGQDWDKDYGILRVGIYLQNTHNASGGLMIKVGSHNASNLTKLFYRILISLEKNLIFRLLGIKKVSRLIRIYFARMIGKASYLNSEIGDVAVWSLRTTHSGGAKRLRIFSNFVLDPYFQKLLPDWCFIDEERERKVIFFAYSKDDEHLKRYILYLNNRFDYKKRFPNGSKVSKEASQFLKANNLL